MPRGTQRVTRKRAVFGAVLCAMILNPNPKPISMNARGKGK